MATSPKLKFLNILNSIRVHSNIVTVAILLLIGHFAFVCNEDIPCAPRYFDADSFVCVCNATYCDTIQKPIIPKNGQILVYTTSRENDRFHAKNMTFQIRNKYRDYSSSDQLQTEKQSTTIIIDATAIKQRIIGFGGSFTDAAGINIKKLSNEAQQKLLKSYFSEKGLEYNLGRVPIGGSDFSPRPYSYDDDSIGDLEFTNFSLQHEDYNYKIPLIKAAQKLSPYKINLVATAWSPPTWMKSNVSFNTGTLNGNVGGIYYKAWAKYHIKFFEEYEKNGVVFWAVTNGNEPPVCFLPVYNINCLGFTPEMLSIFVNQNLAPELRSSKYKYIKLLIYDFNRSNLIQYVTQIMNYPNAEEHVDGIALHWYADKRVSPIAQDITHILYKDKFLLTTEACITTTHFPGPPIILGSWTRADNYAFYIIENLRHWDSGWIDWNLVLDLQGGPSWVKNYVDAPIIVNKTSDEFYKQPMYYVMGHFSKFVPPGSFVIDSKLTYTKDHQQEKQLSSKSISMVAFLTPNSTVVLVVLNRDEADVPVQINDGNSRTLQITIPGSSLQTYIWKI